MKLIETLTSQQITQMVNGSVVGIFTNLFIQSDPFHSKANDMCINYYLNRSGQKTITPYFKVLIDTAEDADSIIARMIRSKFIEKWNRTYDVLLTQQYNPLDNYEFLENRKVDDETTDEGSSTVEDNGKTGTRETTTTSRTISDDVYGFNSVNPVGDTKSTEDVSDTVIGLPDENTNYNKRDEENNNKRIVDRTEDITKNGRDVTGAENLSKELNFRNMQNFFDIVFTDIDSIATLQIYI